MKKLSVKDFKEICKFNSLNNLSYIDFKIGNKESIKLAIKRVLPFKSRVLFISEVVDSCFDDENNYYPENKNIAFKLAIIKYFTTLSLPSDSVVAYDLLIHSDIITKIIDKIEEEEYISIQNEISENINFRKDNIISAQKVNLTKITDAMNTITEQCSNLFKDIDIVDFMSKLDNFNKGFNKTNSETAILNIATNTE